MMLTISGGVFKGRKLKTPSSLSTRPSSGKCRAAVFNICQNKIEDALFLDIFAGAGAMGLEALSRKAKFSFFIENNKRAIECIKKNISLLQVEDKSEVICKDVFSGLRCISKKCDIVYIDPPYKYYEKKDFIEKILRELSSSNILKQGSLIFFEAPKNIDRSLIEKFFIEPMELLSIRKYGSTLLIEIIYH